MFIALISAAEYNIGTSIILLTTGTAIILLTTDT